MGSLVNCNFRILASFKFPRTVDRVVEYHNYIGILIPFNFACSVDRLVKLLNTYKASRLFLTTTIQLSVDT